MRRILFPAIFMALSFGCSVSEVGDDLSSGGDDDRAPIGKADLVGSCVDACDGPAPGGNCWCDELCVEIGDCCADKERACDAPPGPALCLGTEDCGDAQLCDHSECLSGCESDVVCTEVCFGACVDVSDPALCLRDDDCSADEVCDHTECLSGCPEGMACPKICFGECAENEVEHCLASDEDACGEGRYCKFENGSCGDQGGIETDLELGSCTDISEVCTKELDPVCGCDGEDYGNPCLAGAEGTSVRHSGECPVDEPGCANNGDCSAGEFCAKESCDGTGECAIRPELCILVFAPVCSCDGETFSNSCFAAAAGQNVASTRPCSEPTEDE